MAKMTNAQLAAENAALRSKLEELRNEHRELEAEGNRIIARLEAERENLWAQLDAVREERDELVRICEERMQHDRVPSWQSGAQRMRAIHEAAAAQGKRVKFVGGNAVHY